ncbi:MAG: glutathione-dependent disulfide-bond oxidoreductase [Pseudomonadota bacterium]
MNDNDYQPAEIWQHIEDKNAASSSKLNQPTAGARYDQELPKGQNPFQLYSLATPNGQKVTIMFEELIEAGYEKSEYDAYLINIGEGQQFSSGFVDINPNSKIPALLDTENGLKIFESGNILLYLAEKFNAFLSENLEIRTKTLNWLFWLQGSAPYLGGGFGHFYHYAPQKIEYAINRFTMETKRQLDLLDKHLADNSYMNGQDYSIADIVIWPWYGNLILGKLYGAETFLQVKDYKNLLKWAETIQNRPAVQRGIRVNRSWGPEEEQLLERHSPADFTKKPLAQSG